MTIKNTDMEYGSIAKFFHWLIFLLILIMLCVGFFMDDISNPAIKGTVYNLHKLTGLFILTLVVLRLLWAFINKKPKLPRQNHLWERIAERTMHFLLYAAIIAMPLTGWLMSSAAGKAPHIFGINLPLLPVTQSKAIAGIYAERHEFLAWVIIVLVGLHTLAALKHHFIDKDNVLRRMMPKK